MTPNKEEYEKVFNSLLGTDIKWRKLSKEELAQLAVLFDNPEILIKKLIPPSSKDDKKPRFPILQKVREKVAENVVEMMDENP